MQKKRAVTAACQPALTQHKEVTNVRSPSMTNVHRIT
jgi:hypothetical protein